MKNIKELEKLLANWKAVKKDSEISGGIKDRPFTQGVIFGLKTAIGIINRPPNNTVEHGQTKCSVKSSCNVFAEGNCTDYPCPGYTSFSMDHHPMSQENLWKLKQTMVHQ